VPSKATVHRVLTLNSLIVPREQCQMDLVGESSWPTPLMDTRNVAGPEVFALDELGEITLAARGDHRTVITDNSAGMFAAALIAKDGAVITKTTYREWLAR
jgi:hypothetical protein